MSRRPVAGNIIVLSLAVLSLLGYLPWLFAAIIIIAVAVLASLPSSKPKVEAQSSPTTVPTSASTASPPQASDTSHLDQHSAHQQQTRPIQRLPQAIIEALRPVPAAQASKPEEKKPLDVDTGRPVQQVIPAGDYESLEVGIHEGEELSVDVSADGPLNVYVLTEENLSSLDSDQEFWYETGNERSKTASLMFAPEESGTWFLVIENCENRDLTATIKVRVDQPSHPVPLLKSEKLEFPGGRLEGKLGT